MPNYDYYTIYEQMHQMGQ